MKTRIKEPIANYQLTVGELVSELLMTINVCNEKVLVVEGSTDKRFWEMLQKRFNMKMDIRVANKKECDSNKEFFEAALNLFTPADGQACFARGFVSPALLFPPRGGAPDR